jgi:hypothetical protein
MKIECCIGKKITFSIVSLIVLATHVQGQHQHQHEQKDADLKLVEKVDAQPLLMQALRVGEAP